MKMNFSLPPEISGPVLLHIKRGEITACDVLSHNETVAALDALAEAAISSALTTNAAREEQK